MSDPSFIDIADAEQIDADPLRAQTPAARFYTDTDVLNAECHTISSPLALRCARKRGHEPRLSHHSTVAIDNTLECLHGHNAHPAFCDLIDMESYRVTINDGWIHTTGNLKQNDNIVYNVDPSAPVQKTWFAWLWPNTQIRAVPGSPNLSVFTVTSLTPDTLHWHMAHLRLRGTEDQNEDARHIYRTEVLGPEDTVLCESGQRGVRSVGYQRGRFVIDATRPHIGEHQLHYFQSRVLQALSGQS